VHNGRVNEKIQIQPAVPRDAHAIAEMSRDHIETGLGWRYDAARVIRAMRRAETAVLVARRRPSAAREPSYFGRDMPPLAGFAIMDFGDERAHLVLLAVHPGHRRRGVGRALVDWLLESARAAGMASIHLELRAANEAARRFYRALGFSETVLMPRYYDGREAAMRMILVLRTPGPLPLAWRPPALGQK
jgi:ribosomal protein S18 acetylase RimI-like enzyme